MAYISQNRLVVFYMRGHMLKYGFISTYKTTVFFKRVSDYCFHLSPPIDQTATNPSLRECFAGFSVLSAADSKYVEGNDVRDVLAFQPSYQFEPFHSTLTSGGAYDSRPFNITEHSNRFWRRRGCMVLSYLCLTNLASQARK